MAIAPWMKRNSLEVQFWGYEIGNIIASLTGAGGIRAFAESLADAYRAGGASPVAVALWLAREHPELAEVVSDEGAVLAQVAFAVRHEAALHLDDVLLRRTALGTLGHPGQARLQKIAQVMGQELGWDTARVAEEMSAAERALRLPD